MAVAQIGRASVKETKATCKGREPQHPKAAGSSPVVLLSLPVSVVSTPAGTTNINPCHRWTGNSGERSTRSRRKATTSSSMSTKL